MRKIETDCPQGKLKKCLPDMMKFISLACVSSETHNLQRVFRRI